MGMRPDGMERWGVVGIFKESARLLHKHFRLFLPFLLAFHLPASILVAFQYVFLLPSLHPITTFAKAVAAYTTAQGADTDSGPSFIITSNALTLLVLILSFTGTAASIYIVAYIYSNADSPAEDDSIVKKVFKLLPYAFLRILLTQLWIYVVFILLAIPCVLLAFVLDSILSAIVGGPSSPTPAFVYFVMVPYIMYLVALSILFALAEVIAVLEPQKYGRAALQQSIEYAKRRASTIFLVVILLIVTGQVVFISLRAVSNAELPLEVEIPLVILIGVLYSAFSLYAGTVGTVLYFACKSTFEALLPEFQRGINVSEADYPYKPVGDGSTQPKTIREP